MGELSPQQAKKGLGCNLYALQSELRLSIDEQSIHLFDNVFILSTQCLGDLLDSEQTSRVLFNADVLAQEWLIFFIEIAFYIGWQLEYQSIKQLGIFELVRIRFCVLSGRFVKTASESPSDAGWRRVLSDVIDFICGEELQKFGILQCFVKQVDSCLDVTDYDANLDVVLLKVHDEEAHESNTAWVEVFRILLRKQECMGQVYWHISKHHSFVVL